jgi:glucose/arabinose dehydrogenase
MGMRFAIALSAALLAAPAFALDTSGGGVAITSMADGLDEPWGLAFTPEGGFLVTERAGRLRHYLADGTMIEVAGVPDISDNGQGGLLDILLPRDFDRTRLVYLSYAKPQDGGEGTALGVGRLSDDGARLEGFRSIFEMAPGSSGGRHFGSRIVEAADGTLFLTIGDRGEAERAQDLGLHNGKVIRLNRDGSIPADNPFVGREGALPEIWSYGHRNPQGAALGPDGALYTSEHGAQGGDEVNRPEAGRNYGWPVITYGIDYDGSPIGEGTEKAGMEQPLRYWDPSIAPSGFLFYSGKLWPEWRGDAFVGSLKFDYIARLDPEAGWAEERIEAPETGRVRDIREAPDGTIWFLSVNEGAVFRIAPAE